MSGDAKRGLKPPVYIDTDVGLRKLVASLRTKAAIAVDTEANPLFAYRERLCLVQISTKSRDYIIDPLADVDLGLLVPIFADPNIVKVFHDAEFDVLMLKRTLPIELNGIFDTKVAAMSLGVDGVGLAAILKAHFGVILDKKYQRSDWGRRPLTEGQLDYARYDTHFLIPLADQLRERIHAADEINQLEVSAECRRVEMLIPDVREFNPDDFTKIKGWDRLDPARRRVLRELFVARHQIADRLDRPAFKVIPSEMLLRIAKSSPETMEALKREKLMSVKLRERHGDEVLAAIARGRRLSPLPDEKIQRTRKDYDCLGDEQRAVYEALRTWRKRAAVKRGADASLVLPRSMMMELARQRARPRDLDGLRNCGILEPWRIDYYGEGILGALQDVARGDRPGTRRGNDAVANADDPAPQRRPGADSGKTRRERTRRVRRVRTGPEGAARDGP